MRNGERVASLKCGTLCCLLTAAPILGQGTIPGGAGRGAACAGPCLVLNCETGSLWSAGEALAKGVG
jgi:hypothetical protein